MILDLDPDALHTALRTQDKDAVLPDVVHGVAQKVVQCTLHHFGVGVNGQFLVRQFELELPAVLRTDRVVPLADLVAEHPHIKMDPLALDRAAGDLAQLHNAGDQRGQTVGFVHDDVHLLVALFFVVAGQIAHRFGVALDEGERGAQIVRDVCQQIPLHLCRVLHFGSHVVEIPRKVAQFIAAAGLDLDLIVALCHLAGRAGKLAQRLCEPLAEQPRCSQGKGKDECCGKRQHLAQNVGGFRDVHKAGGDHDRISAGSSHPPDQQLRRAGQPRRVQILYKAAGVAAPPPHGDGSGNDIVIFCVREHGFVQVAVGLVLQFVNGAQGGIGDVHAKAAQGAVGVKIPRELVEKAVVDIQMPERPVGEGLTVFQRFVQPRGNSFGLCRELRFNVLGVERLQQPGG